MIRGGDIISAPLKTGYTPLGHRGFPCLNEQFNNMRISYSKTIGGKINMANDPRGTIVQQGYLMRINNALVEEVRCSNGTNGYIVVSYAVRGANQTVSIQNIRLNIGNNTVILSSFGQRLRLCQIRRGQWVNTVFSSRMTRSIPPQSNAFLITVQRNSQLPIPPVPPRPQPSPSSTTIGRITMVDVNNRFFNVLDSNNRNNLIRFNVNNFTSYSNRFGIPIRFGNLQPGQMVRVTHANFQTPSIPPQTTAFNVQII